MFDTRITAKKIRDARIAQNMTQMNLADAMGVSYQAVSNWERGNSMPDISKLEDLCRVLKLELPELLGTQPERHTAVTKLIREEDPLTVEELTEIAPMLPPEEVKKQSENKQWNISALVEIAPFLEESYLEELVESVQIESLKKIVELAPFLSEKTLDKLVRRAPKGDYEGIQALAPFLEEETLNWVVLQYDLDMDEDFVIGLAPFLKEQTLDALVRTQLKKGNAKHLVGLCPFLGRDTLRAVAKYLMAEGDLEGMKKAAPFL